MALPDLPLKDYDESQLSYVLRLALYRLEQSEAAANPSYVAARVSDAIYGAKLALGFGEGLFAGVRARYAVMRDDFRRDYALIQKLFSADFVLATGTALAASFDEWFVRPAFETVPTGLKPEAAAAAARMIEMFDAMALLNTLGLVDDITKAGHFWDMLGAGVDDLLDAVAMEAQGWARRAILEPDPVRQGAMLGELAGTVLFEVVRTIVEPPAVDAAHMISSFGITSSERQVLGI